MAALPDKRVRTLPEADSVKIARIEEAVVGIREDVSDMKGALHSLRHEINYLGDVRVRGLEDREIARKAVADERGRASDAARAAAEEAAASAATQKDRQVSRRQFVGGLIAVVVLAPFFDWAIPAFAHLI